MRERVCVVLCVLLAGGCAGMRIENTPLRAGDGNPDLRTIDPASPERPVILMTFSGGGSRAAALAESVLRELSQTSYAASDGPHVLTSPQWAKAVEAGRWPSQVRPFTRNRRHVLYRIR